MFESHIKQNGLFWSTYLPFLPFFYLFFIVATVTLSKTLITPSPGKTNSVTCTVSGGERFTGWFDPAGKKVPTSSSEKIYVETTGNNHKLKLTDVKVSYGGTYTCKGTTNSESLKVHVECKLHITLLITNVASVVSAQAANICCLYGGFCMETFQVQTAVLNCCSSFFINSL